MYSSVSVYLEKLKSYCSYQERCHQEVAQKLFKLGADKDQANEVIFALMQENYLKEERYAKALVRGKFRMNHWGRIKIIQQLKLKNISPKLIELALIEIDEKEYMNTIKMLMEKKRALYDSELDFILIDKIMKSVIQKGFETELVIDAANKLFRS
jgi:regulatory protein